MQNEIPFRRQRFFLNRLLTLLFILVFISMLILPLGSAVIPGIARLASPLFCPAETILQTRLPERLQLSIPVYYECVDSQGNEVITVSGKMIALIFVGTFSLAALSFAITATGGYVRSVQAFFNPDELPARDVPVSMFPQTFLGNTLHDKNAHLHSLQQAYDSGALTDEDYEKRRREIMGL
jgi:hypothetical protein